jgi:hypothetical protein
MNGCAKNRRRSPLVPHAATTAEWTGATRRDGP